MFLQYAVPGAWVPLFSVWLQNDRHFGPVELGWAFAAQAFASLATPLLAGQVADRWLPVERCLTVCALAAGGFLWLLPSLGSPAAVFGANLGFWLALSPALMLGTALSFAHLPAPERDFGVIRLWGTVGWVLPGWLLGYHFSDPAWLSAVLAWLRPEHPRSELADACRLAALFAFGLSLYGLTLPHTPPQPRPGSWLAPWVAIRLLRDRSFAVFCAGSLGVSMTFAFSAQATPLLLEHLGIPRAWLSPTLTIAQGVEVLSLALLPWLFLRLGTRGTMLLGLGVWSLGLAAFAVGEPLWLVIAALGGWGVCVCCYLVAGQVFVNSRARGDIRASAQGLLTCVNGLGQLAGHLLVGGVRRWTHGDFAATFTVAAAIAAAVAVVFLVGFSSRESGSLAGEAAVVGPEGPLAGPLPAPAYPDAQPERT
jgi:MFS family permease